MPNPLRPSAANELKEPLAIIDAEPHGWWAIHTALIHAARRIRLGEDDLFEVALGAVKRAADAGFRSLPDDSKTRFTGKAIMQWQDALYVVNELPEWRFPDSVLLIAWMVECGGPDMGRGPARARFHLESPEHYVGGTRNLYNSGAHGNGSGWPKSREWSAGDCRYMAGITSRTKL
jgi:hypothetical protein